MNNSKKLCGQIGLCYSSSNVIFGTDNIVSMMKNNKVTLVLLSQNASINTQKLIQNKARTYNVQIVLIDETTMNVMSNAIKKKNIVVLAVKNHGFAKLILKTIKE